MQNINTTNIGEEEHLEFKGVAFSVIRDKNIIMNTSGKSVTSRNYKFGIEIGMIDDGGEYLINVATKINKLLSSFFPFYLSPLASSYNFTERTDPFFSQS